MAVPALEGASKEASYDEFEKVMQFIYTDEVDLSKVPDDVIYKLVVIAKQWLLPGNSLPSPDDHCADEGIRFARNL